MSAPTHHYVGTPLPLVPGSPAQGCLSPLTRAAAASLPQPPHSKLQWPHPSGSTGRRGALKVSDMQGTV